MLRHVETEADGDCAACDHSHAQTFDPSCMTMKVMRCQCSHTCACSPTTILERDQTVWRTAAYLINQDGMQHL